AEHLTAQLRLALSDPRKIEIGEFLIGCLDERGYLMSTIAEIAGDLHATEDDVRAVLEVVQGFEPAGVGARSLQECLLQQLAAAGESESLAARIIRDRWADLSE